MSDRTSQQLFERAGALFPGGVNSPVRAFRAVGGKPVFIASARGAEMFGADGTAYVDYVGSWGPLIAGHAHPAVVQAVREAAARGSSFGAPTEARSALGRGGSSGVPVDADDAHDLERDRGGHGRLARRARVHRPRPDREVRGLLSRRRGLPAGQGRQRSGHVRRAGQRGRAERDRGHDAGLALQRPGGGACAARGARCRDRRADRRTGRWQHGLRAARAGLLAGPTRVDTRPRRVARVRRSDDRLSRRASAAPKRSTACVRT